jgi:lipoate-protein ligase A
MELVTLQSTDARSHLACDEALLRRAEAGLLGEVLRFYEITEPTVVLGIGGKLRREVKEENCRAHGVAMLRRCSGGGAVLLARGCLNYSLVLDTCLRHELAGIRQSYRAILSLLTAALEAACPALRHAGLADLALGGRKAGGSAQRRLRRYILHHGTLLYGLDPALVQRYLRPPVDSPDYRAGRPHAEFMANLPLSVAELKDAVSEAFGVPRGTMATALGAEPVASVAELVVRQYGREEWNLRR